MGPAERDNDAIRKLLAGGGGFGPPLPGSALVIPHLAPSLACLGEGVNQVVTRRTASRKNAGGNGFSTTSAPASRRNVNASRFAVSPVMKMKRRASEGSSLVASR